MATSEGDFIGLCNQNCHVFFSGGGGGGGSCDFQPSLRGGSLSFAPNGRGGSCVF